MKRKQQVTDLMCHGKAQNSGLMFEKSLFLDQFLHTVIEDVYPTASFVFGTRCETEDMIHVG